MANRIWKREDYYSERRTKMDARRSTKRDKKPKGGGGRQQINCRGVGVMVTN